MDEIVLNPGDTVTIPEPEPIPEAVIESAVAAGVATGIEEAQQGEVEWARLSYDVLSALLRESREQRTELKDLQNQTLVRLRDLDQSITSLNLRLETLSASQPVTSQEPIPEAVTVETLTMETEPEDRVVQKEEAENPVPKIVKQKKNRIV